MVAPYAGHQRTGEFDQIRRPQPRAEEPIGNFGIDRNKGDWYDRYTGVKELMPFAKAVSAKTYDFDEKRPFVTIDSRWDKETDFLKMMKIVLDAGYKGWVGIEYEGGKLDEYEGIRRSKALLDRCAEELA